MIDFTQVLVTAKMVLQQMMILGLLSIQGIAVTAAVIQLGILRDHFKQKKIDKDKEQDGSRIDVK
jgi:hypothetical protein